MVCISLYTKGLYVACTFCPCHVLPMMGSLGICLRVFILTGVESNIGIPQNPLWVKKEKPFGDRRQTAGFYMFVLLPIIRVFWVVTRYLWPMALLVKRNQLHVLSLLWTLLLPSLRRRERASASALSLHLKRECHSMSFYKNWGPKPHLVFSIPMLSC